MFTPAQREALARKGLVSEPEALAALEFAGAIKYTFFQANVAAVQTAVALNIFSADHVGVAMLVPGHIVGIVVTSNAEPTAGNLTAEVTIGGTGVGLSAALTDGVTWARAAQEPGVDAFDVLDLLGVDITTDAGWLPVTADILVDVFVALGGVE